MAKKIFLGVAIVALLLVTGLLITIALQPSTFAVERTVTIAAPPAAVFSQVNDFQAWDTWSPWRELDPHAKTTMSNPSGGRGATFGWDGNDEVGAGTMTIVDSQPDERVDVDQVFVRPFAGKCRLTFALRPTDSGTKVVWSMNGTNDFFGKAMCLFMDMDTIVGAPFEKGLANIKQIAEKSDESPSTETPATETPSTETPTDGAP